MVEMVPAVIVVVIAIVIIIAIYFILTGFGRLTRSSQNVLGQPSSNRTGSNTIAQFTDINIQEVYEGSMAKNNVTCNYYNYTHIDGRSLKVGGGQAFALSFKFFTSQCPIQLTNIKVNTPGFTFTYADPYLPFDLPPNSQADIQLNFVAPQTNFYGPLTITVYEH